MLVHKGGQINNVQLITGLRIAEMSQLQNCSVKCTKIFKKKNFFFFWGGGGGGGGGASGWGQGGCERRSKVFVKIQNKKKIEGGGGGWGGVRSGVGVGEMSGSKVWVRWGDVGYGGCKPRIKGIDKCQ